jgi:foldase protein PrsA
MKTVKCCDAEYQAVVQQKIMPYLVQRTEFEQQAAKLGVVATPKEIDAAIKKIVKQYFNGSQAKFLAAIKKQGSTLPEVRDTVGLNVLQQNVTAKLTANLKVTNAEALAYYNKNKSAYQKPTSRDLSHILVKTKALAQKIYDQLKAGADFAKLAKKYSTDTGSAKNGGKLGVQAENALVAPFSKVAFKIPTGTISTPVHTQFGWHIIKANGPVIPESTAPFSKEKAAIVQELLQAKKGDATSAWQTKIEKFYAGKVKYASAYAPPKATTPGDTTLFPTTPAGG